MINKFLIILLVLSSGTYSSSVAQAGYKITYGISHNVNLLPTDSNYKTLMKKVVVFTDSVSYFYYLRAHEKDYLQNGTEYGRKLIHHTQLNYLGTLQYYHYMIHSPTRKNNYLIQGNIEKPVSGWSIDSSEATYFREYKCFQASALLPSGDTVFVSYTPDIPVPFGPEIYPGLPGVALEAFDSIRGRYYFVIDIQKGAFRIQRPENIKIRKATPHPKNPR